jgi:hypothetical protein
MLTPGSPARIFGQVGRVECRICAYRYTFKLLTNIFAITIMLWVSVMKHRWRHKLFTPPALEKTILIFGNNIWNTFLCFQLEFPDNPQGPLPCVVCNLGN